MFKKLLANLPFNPSLLDQVAFYAHRMRRESEIRRLGFVFLVLAMAVQLTAALYPAEKSLATGKHHPKPPPTSSNIVISKSVSNLTKSVWDANGSTVATGDILEFKLITKNTGNGAKSDYKGEDFFGRVLQYADITDTAALKSQGVTLGSDKYLRWEDKTIAAGATHTKLIRVKVKEAIPLTNNPSPGSADYNCTISNTYGNSVSLKVPCPPIKVVAEAATAELPKTGPGLSVFVSGAFAALAGYLYARSRVLAKELELVRRDYISSGGV